ncbi:alpha/beta hydrolase [Amycolatopsis sp. OK19-0408]|uniref:Alpha/beta hydrolase n=1 Tax=Amycolatopsis iheyensis TaxID=2945988 RepID=A0A9X2SKE3_9PSEU|nr:alpha/beta hydrolase [Amycolatopsis iheyensis]MCR6483280.1 alpha/beta hydrolase [Amycolatopsis iheyensis]
MNFPKLRAALALGAAAGVVALSAPAAEAGSAGIVWESACATGYQCGHLDVPMSYQDPSAGTVSIAVGRLPATDQAHKLGTIFYNPGGPGSSGRLAPALTPFLHERYDIVGFDPRGVGASSKIHCFTDPSQLEVLQRALGTFPLTRAAEQQQIADTKTVTDLCEQNGGPLANHLSTGTIARDLDRLRAAFGEQKLRYYGKSYGTYLGETYANLFPGRVGSLALDAVDDPMRWASGTGPMSYRLRGYEDGPRAIQSFLDACAARCPFDYNAILDRLEAGPITVTDTAGQQVVVTYQSAIAQIHDYLTDAQAAPQLAAFLQALADPASRAPVSAGGLPDVDSLLGGGATLCSDAANPRDPAVWWDYARRADQVGRGFGRYDVYKTLPCATWDVADTGRYAGPWNRPTAPVLLLANRQGDLETPYAGAQRTEKLLGNARLLTLDTYGHGSRGKSACVDAWLDRYFAAGSVPARGTVCAPDRGPFD